MKLRIKDVHSGMVHELAKIALICGTLDNLSSETTGEVHQVTMGSTLILSEVYDKIRALSVELEIISNEI